MPRSSAAAATGPSTRARTLAGGFLTLVSGTSNTPFATVSLRPDGIWTTPRPSVTVVVRPLTRVTRSTSRICGRLSNGCRVAPVVWIAIDKPSSGTGGPPERKVEIGALVVISPCSIDPPAVRSMIQVRTAGVINGGHICLNAASESLRAAIPIFSRGSDVE